VDRRRFHTTFVGGSKTTELLDKILAETDLRIFFTDKQHVMVQRSNYASYKCTSTSFIKPARIFTTMINASEKDRLEESLRQYSGERAKVEQSKRAKQPELQRLLIERQEAEVKWKDVQSKINHKLQSKAKLDAAKLAMDKLAKGDGTLEQFRRKAKQDIRVSLGMSRKYVCQINYEIILLTFQG